jgi:hypothetical protein
MITRPKLSSIVASQLPEFVREDYQTFVLFLQAYYDYLDTTNPDVSTLRDIDKTLDSFIGHIKNELLNNFPVQTATNQSVLLQHIKEYYLSKGSESSYKFLFRLLYGKEVSIDYPSKQILRASDGKWNQDVSIMVQVNAGQPDDIVGKMVDVVTANTIVRILVDHHQTVEFEVDRIVQISPNTYEFYIDRRFFGSINVGDQLRYKTNSIYFSGTILATTSQLKVLTPGTGFKLGQLYTIRNGHGSGSIMKITRIDSNGGIINAEFIKYGIGYSTDFTSTIYADTGQTSAGTGGLQLSLIGRNLDITEATDGFTDDGTINYFDYAVGTAIDGTYAGQVLREFGDTGTGAVVSPYDPAVIKVSLGPLARYPGYYSTNDGFLNDAMFIQDSRYYQAFSYVIKIDERLDDYKSYVKSLVHPAGVAVFGEYSVTNEFDLSPTLDSLLKILAVTTQDVQNIIDNGTTLLTTKGLGDATDVANMQNDFIASIVTSKPLADTINTPDDSVYSLLTTKGLTENQPMVDSGTTLVTTKALTDYPTMGDVITERDITKALTDAPIISEQPYFATTKYINNTGSGDDLTHPVDSGGFIIFNPYSEAGWFLEQYVGTPINFSG